MAGAAATFAFKKIARHDFLSLNAGVYPTRSSLQITGLQHELLAQYYNVTNLKHELVLGLRTQYFYSLSVSAQLETKCKLAGAKVLSRSPAHIDSRGDIPKQLRIDMCRCVHPCALQRASRPHFVATAYGHAHHSLVTVRSLAVEQMGAKSQSFLKNTQTLRFSLTTTRYYARTKNGFR